MPFVGAAMRRLEDPRLLRGQGAFIEDLELPRELRVAFVRSQFAHARLASIDLEPARQTPGILAAFDARDLGVRRIPAVVTHSGLRPCAQPILADGVVRYVGEPIAVVLGETRAAA